MKRKVSKEPDLFVIKRKLSEKESKEVSDFIEEYKSKRASSKKRKHSKAA